MVVHLPNCAAWMVMFLAVLRAGQVPATPPITTTAAHLRHIFDLIAPAMVVSVERHRHASPAGTVWEAASGAAAQVAVL